MSPVTPLHVIIADALAAAERGSGPTDPAGIGRAILADPRLAVALAAALHEADVFSARESAWTCDAHPVDARRVLEILGSAAPARSAGSGLPERLPG